MEHHPDPSHASVHRDEERRLLHERGGYGSREATYRSVPPLSGVASAARRGEAYGEARSHPEAVGPRQKGGTSGYADVSDFGRGGGPGVDYGATYNRDNQAYAREDDAREGRGASEDVGEGDGGAGAEGGRGRGTRRAPSTT